jgi:hypothetical protein
MHLPSARWNLLFPHHRIPEGVGGRGMGAQLAEAAAERAAGAASDAASGFPAAALDAAMELDAEPLPGVDEQARRVTGASYRVLAALVQQKDPTLAHTGLQKVQAAAGDDATIEWVSEAGAARFRAEGRRALLSGVGASGAS